MCVKRKKQATLEVRVNLRNFEGLLFNFKLIKIELKSLILAQIERWRYA